MQIYSIFNSYIDVEHQKIMQIIEHNAVHLIAKLLIQKQGVIICVHRSILRVQMIKSLIINKAVERAQTEVRTTSIDGILLRCCFKRQRWTSSLRCHDVTAHSCIAVICVKVHYLNSHDNWHDFKTVCCCLSICRIGKGQRDQGLDKRGFNQDTLRKSLVRVPHERVQ